MNLGPYQVRSELGRGAMAVVWRAYDPVLDREVAVKEPLLPVGVDDVRAAEFGARFVREAKAAARLNHPNIVTIHAADIYEGHAAIVMELVQGQTLGQMLGRGPVAPALMMSILEQLLAAVGYSHQQGIVHRDIKPDNIFITPEGRVKLADFGIASLASDVTLTQAGTVMGTPGYMAPEQVTGDPVDGRADLFAIGVLAYEMITGRNPFGTTEGLPITTVLYRIVHEAPPEMPPHTLAALPSHMRSVLQVALAKDSVARFPDAAGFLAGLRGEAILPVHEATSATLASAGAAKTGSTGGRGLEGRRSWAPYVAAAVLLGVVVTVALLVTSKTGGTAMVAVEPTEAPIVVPIVATTLSSTTTTTTVQTGQTVQVTKYGAELTLPEGWEITKPLVVDSGVSWFEATGPDGMFMRCISHTLWSGWHSGGPESFHEGDRQNFVNNHPDVVDVALNDAWFGEVYGLRWDYAFNDDGEGWAGIAFYFPMDADSSQTPSEIAIRFPDDSGHRSEVEDILETFSIR